MSLLLLAGTATLGLLGLGLLARHERQTDLAARAAVLDPCLPLFDCLSQSIGIDGFPRLDGHIGSRRIVMRLIPDSLTIRRLPQLWLSLGFPAPLALPGELAVVARPRGTEFFAVAPRLSYRLEPGATLPTDLLARGSGPAAQLLLDQLERPLAALLDDPRVKEVAITGKGLRCIFQVAQGERGEHLLLRQCRFRDARLDAATAVGLIDRLGALHEQLHAPEMRILSHG